MMEQTDPSSESSGSPSLVPCPGSPRKFLRLAPRVGHPTPPHSQIQLQEESATREWGLCGRAFLEPPPYQEGSRITVILLPYAFFENHGISVTPPVTKTSGNGKLGFLQKHRETPLCQDTFYARTPFLGQHFARTPLFHCQDTLC